MEVNKQMENKKQDEKKQKKIKPRTSLNIILEVLFWLALVLFFTDFVLVAIRLFKI